MLPLSLVQAVGARTWDVALSVPGFILQQQIVIKAVNICTLDGIFRCVPRNLPDLFRFCFKPFEEAQMPHARFVSARQ